jgi:hypothetical protein
MPVFTNPGWRQFTVTPFSFNLKALLNDEIDDISLFKEDVLTIISKNDLNKDEYIKISGEVNNPGTYPFSNNLSLSDIITLSGGFNENSFKNRVEIIRRI